MKIERIVFLIGTSPDAWMCFSAGCCCTYSIGSYISILIHPTARTTGRPWPTPWSSGSSKSLKAIDFSRHAVFTWKFSWFLGYNGYHYTVVCLCMYWIKPEEGLKTYCVRVCEGKGGRRGEGTPRIDTLLLMFPWFFPQPGFPGPDGTPVSLHHYMQRAHCVVCGINKGSTDGDIESW